MKVLTDSGLGHLIEKLKSLLPGSVSEEAPGLMPKLSGNPDDVMHGDGNWAEQSGGASIEFATEEDIQAVIESLKAGE